MRLIDADALHLEIAKLGFVHFRAGGCHPGDGAIPVAEALELCNNAPTVDAVAVVRCADCRRYWRNVGAKESGMLCYKCPPGEEDKYFCADGEIGESHVVS